MDLIKFFEGVRDFDALLSGQLKKEQALTVLAKAEQKTKKFFAQAMGFIEAHRKPLLKEEENRNGQERPL